MESLSRSKKTHNDIKPQNFVVKYDSSSTYPYRIYLTDFGLAEKKGGTPVFASPECFEDDKHNSDIFSLGRVFLYTILDKSDFFLWLYMPIPIQLKRKLDQVIEQEPILKLIRNMTKMTNRYNIRTVRKHFDLIRQSSVLNLVNSVDTTVNNILFDSINEETIRNFYIHYIDELYNLS